MKSQSVLTKQLQIAENAKILPDTSFTSLAYHIDLEWMYEAFKDTDKNKATGVDNQTADDFVRNLKGNLTGLLNNCKSGQYRAPNVKRVYIPKENGKDKRPLGIPTFSDKILQRAIKMVVEPVFEEDFYDFSFGFRKGKSTHKALKYLRKQIMDLNDCWIIDLDISKYFDTIDHRKLREMFKRRVCDGVIIRMIGKWLSAGIMEKGECFYQENGTPQGGVISPLLSNIYLHEVLDNWFVTEVQPRMRDRSFIVRYADDAVLGFKRKEDAERVYRVLGKRFERYNLKLNKDKTKLVYFGNEQHPKEGDSNKYARSFDFLGFTLYWGKTRSSNWKVVKLKTSKKRFSSFIKRVKLWLKKNMHQSLKEIQMKLNLKLQGHYNYYGVTFNINSLENVLNEIKRRLWRILKRRTRKDNLTAIKFTDKILANYPLAVPRIKHNIIM